MHVYRFKLFFFFSSRRRHTRSLCDWSSDVCSSDLSGCLSYLASAERAFALLDEQPEVPERPNARPLQRAVGAVEIGRASCREKGQMRARRRITMPKYRMSGNKNKPRKRNERNGRT